METPLLELPFQEAQRIFNSFYYQQGSKHADGFSTFTSKGTRLAYAEAAAFHRSLSARFRKGAPQSIRVLELGCGNGDSAFRFLEKLKQLDGAAGTDFFPRLNCTLADFSSQALKDVLTNEKLSRFADSLDFELADAESLRFKEGNFLLVRANGLFSDFPTQLIALHGGAFHELWLGMHLDADYDIFTIEGDPVARSEFAWLAYNRLPSLLSQVDGTFVKKLELEVKRKPAKIDSASHMLLHSTLGRIPEGAVIPLPFAASACLAALRPFLAKGGAIDTFDYGFNSLTELESLQPGIFRTPGALTTFVNFPYLKAIAPMLGYKSAIVEPQDKFTGGRPEKNSYHLRLCAGD